MRSRGASSSFSAAIFLSLPRELVLGHTVRNGQALRVVGDGDVFVAELRGRLGHRTDRRGAVAAFRVHL
jgi:hypothetical protein